MDKLSESVSVVSEGNNSIFIIDNDQATARISLYGAQVISFIPKSDNKERLWLSPETKTDSSEVIRGGVPLCWPWFANQFPDNAASKEEKLSSHGFLRNNFWRQERIEEPTTDSTRMTFIFDVTPRPGFRYCAKIKFTVEISSTLKMALSFENNDNSPFNVTGALHTYFQVDELSQTQLIGLSGQYKDKTQADSLLATPEDYRFSKETDNVHLTNTPDVAIQGQQSSIAISARGHDSHVVWNPGAEAVKAIGNIANQDYQRFLCVEAAITSELTVHPGNSHTLSQTIS